MGVASHVKSPATNAGCPDQSKATSLETRCVVKSSRSKCSEAIFRSTEPMKSKKRAGKSEERNSSSEREEEVDEMSVIRRDPASVCPDVPTQQHDKSPHKNTASQSATNASLTRRRSWRLGLPFPRSAQFFRGSTHPQSHTLVAETIIHLLWHLLPLWLLQFLSSSTGSSNEMRITTRKSQRGSATSSNRNQKCSATSMRSASDSKAASQRVNLPLT